VIAPIWNNEELRARAPTDEYRLADVARLEKSLADAGTLTLRPLASGMFPAASASAQASGYGNVWVRDNVYVAHALLSRGDGAAAARTARAILQFWWSHRQRFQAIISGEVDADAVMQRPHVRFDGAALRELVDEKWSHAQNDALGYALWLCARLVRAGLLPLDEPVAGMLQLLPRYLAAIGYWRDRDSGHWEETRKRSASSIGTALAGVEALLALGAERWTELRAAGVERNVLDLARELQQQGRAALSEILPSESVDPSPGSSLARRYDAALLFLVHPLRVVDASVAQQITADIERELTGAYGIRRYPGDSYWAPDYDLRLAAEDRTRDYSDDIATRDTLLQSPGDEAQWCIFDPLLSAHYGQLYVERRQPEDLARQVHHLQRSLAQITPDWRCPELYYLKHGARVPGPHTPLLWTVANLTTALAAMRQSATLS
jgi:phosphorylase kinase alpha/beta subunit